MVYTPSDHCQTVQQLYIEMQLRESLCCQDLFLQGQRHLHMLNDSLRATKILLALHTEKGGGPNSAAYQVLETLMEQLALPQSYRTDLTYHIKRALCDGDAPLRFAVCFGKNEVSLFDPRCAAALESAVTCTTDPDAHHFF